MIKIKVEPGTTLDHLMTLEQYEKQIASEDTLRTRATHALAFEQAGRSR